MKYTIEEKSYGTQVVTVEFVATNEVSAQLIIDKLKKIVAAENEDIVRRAMKGTSEK